MFGAIVGDIVGSYYELKENRTKNYNFKMFPQGSMFTDDTTFTVAVADAYLDYLESKSNNLEEYKTLLINKMVIFGKSHNYFSEKMTSWLSNPVPMGLSGTGAAMRVSALAYLCDNINDLKKIVRITSEISHNNAEAVDAAECAAICVYFLLRGKDKKFLHDYVISNYYPYLDNYNYDKVQYRYSFYSPTSLHVQTAINCFLESSSFEDCLRKVVSLGGDSDTQGAIAASMAEVFYGIPVYFEQKAKEYLSDDIIFVLKRFEQYIKNKQNNENHLLFDLLNGKTSLAVVGLGYVGLPIAIEFSKHVKVVAFDLNKNKINDYKQGVFPDDIVDVKNADKLNILWTNNEIDLRGCKFIIVAVPTPINCNKLPDLECLQKASEIVGRNLTKGSIIVYESTVYPGATENFCKKILEECSNCLEGIDFKLGYSPERINPGDKNHKLPDIVKVVSGSDESTTDTIAKVYDLIIDAGIRKASSIKVAESAKIIENCQRDVNIAFMNELSLIFSVLDIDFKEILEVAATKWNFLRFHPGLVGGHCIGVDPYYLINEAKENGVAPSLMITARDINESMSYHVAKVINEKLVEGGKIGILGITFKPNCKDVRNTKVLDIYNNLKNYEVYVHDNKADSNQVKTLYGIELVGFEQLKELDCLVIAVPHDEYKNILLIEYLSMFNNVGRKIIIDLYGIIDKAECEMLDMEYWSL